MQRFSNARFPTGANTRVCPIPIDLDAFQVVEILMRKYPLARKIWYRVYLDEKAVVVSLFPFSYLKWTAPKSHTWAGKAYAAGLGNSWAGQDKNCQIGGSEKSVETLGPPNGALLHANKRRRDGRPGPDSGGWLVRRNHIGVGRHGGEAFFVKSSDSERNEDVKRRLQERFVFKVGAKGLKDCRESCGGLTEKKRLTDSDWGFGEDWKGVDERFEDSGIFGEARKKSSNDHGAKLGMKRLLEHMQAEEKTKKRKSEDKIATPKKLLVD